MTNNTFGALRDFEATPGKTGRYYSLATLELAGLGRISRLPVSLRIVLESLLRNCEGKRVTEEHVRNLAAWQADGKRTTEIPFIVVRIVLQDLIGFGTLNDLSAMGAGCVQDGTRRAAGQRHHSPDQHGVFVARRMGKGRRLVP